MLLRTRMTDALPVPCELQGYAVADALETARMLCEEGCEPTSALKEAASSIGIEFGTAAMKAFVDYGNEWLLQNG